MSTSGYLLLALGLAVVAALGYRQHRVALRVRDEELARGVPESTRLNVEAAPRDLLVGTVLVALAAVVVGAIGVVRGLLSL